MAKSLNPTTSLEMTTDIPPHFAQSHPPDLISSASDMEVENQVSVMTKSYHDALNIEAQEEATPMLSGIEYIEDNAALQQKVPTITFARTNSWKQGEHVPCPSEGSFETYGCH